MYAPVINNPATAKEAKSGTYKFECIDPRPTGKEANEVINVLNGMLQALARCDFKKFSENLDEHAYMFDSQVNDVVLGKERIVARFKEAIKKEKKEKSPLLSLTIREPYAITNGDVAVVTYSAEERFGGVNPRRLQSRCSNVFVKKDNKWFMVQHREDWKPVTKKNKSDETAK